MSWFGNLFFHLFSGLIFLVMGWISKLVPTKKINYIMGYRTTRSMKNHDTWQEANNYFPTLMIKAGAISLILGMIGFVLLNNETSILLSSILPLILIFYVIYATEKHLKNTFDQEGNRLK